MDYRTQAERADKYKDKSYISPRRWSSYYIQVREAMLLKPRRILEIGPGNGIVSRILRDMDFEVETLDIDERLGIDHSGSITDENLAEKLAGKFDLVIACQILEHIKYEDFHRALRNIKVIAPNAIISLPHTELNSRFFHLSLIAPLIWQLNLSWKLVFNPVRHEFNGEHYWDMGTKGFPIRKIKHDIIKKGWQIKKSFFNPDNPYHYFFVLKDENKH